MTQETTAQKLARLNIETSPSRTELRPLANELAARLKVAEEALHSYANYQDDGGYDARQALTACDLTQPWSVT